jgi:hypothetical protein
VAEKEGKNKEMAKTTVENKEKVKGGHRHETTDGSLHPQLGLTRRRDYETPLEDGFCSHFAESRNLSTIWRGPRWIMSCLAFLLQCAVFS